VIDFAEVFTPSGIVDTMLDLVVHEIERIDARILEPACGSGNFLVPSLKRKLATVESRFRKSVFEKQHHALSALMSIYGIELLEDNAAECRNNLLTVLSDYLKVDSEAIVYLAASKVVELNIVQGNALNMTTSDDEPIMFPEWGYLGQGKFQRRDFEYKSLTERSSWDPEALGPQDSSISLDKQGMFTPTQMHPKLSMKEIGL